MLTQSKRRIGSFLLCSTNLSRHPPKLLILRKQPLQKRAGGGEKGRNRSGDSCRRYAERRKPNDYRNHSSEEEETEQRAVDQQVKFPTHT